MRITRLAILPIAIFFMAVATTPLRADSITIQSDMTNLGAAVASVSDPALTSGQSSGLPFTPVLGNQGGTFTAPPPGAPSSTITVNIPPGCGYYCGYSGFVETTFTLPASFTNISLTGAGNVDDWGYVFLNGNLISPELSEFASTGFTTSDPVYFLPGVNTFMVSDSNSGGGPSGVAYYAEITYTPGSAPTIPEPGSLLLIGSGLVGLAGMVRRKIGPRA